MTYFDGLKIFKSYEIKRESLILVCSTVRTRTVIKKLKLMGYRDFLHYSSFYRHAKFHGLALKEFDLIEEEYKINYDRFSQVYNMLADVKSKKIFEDIIAYKITSDIAHTKLFSFDIETQYFEDFLYLSREVFVDCGAYDGETTINFIKKCPDYEKVYLVEPSEDSLNLAKIKLSGFDRLSYFNVGAHQKRANLKFDSSLGASCSVKDDGDTEIAVDSLDNLISDKITYLKMDLEGSEVFAIKGSRKHILNDHPKLAISVYHRADDLWKIPFAVLAINCNYKIFLRHYTEGAFETVMYFVPVK